MLRRRSLALVCLLMVAGCASGSAKSPRRPAEGTGGSDIEAEDAGAGGSGAAGRGGSGGGGTGGGARALDAGPAEDAAGGGSPLDVAPAADSGADGAGVDAARDLDRPDVPPLPPGAFRHPGVLVNAAQLALIGQQVKQGAQPWKGAYDLAVASAQAALDRVPKPRDMVVCGPGSNPNLGCSDERGDAAAAYTQILLWNITGDEARARKAVEILDAWNILVGHSDSNAPLQAGWSGALFARAAELTAHTYTGWPAADVAKFKAMLRTAFLPIVNKTSGANGNWELVMTEASIGIAVFLDDRAIFDQAVARWRKRVPAYIYLGSDGPTPVPPPTGNGNTPAALAAFWNDPGMYVDGLAQETCRDFGHTEWGFAAAANTAEIALQQGLDLYAAESARMRAGLEFHAQYTLHAAPWPASLCGGVQPTGFIPTWEIAYNHYATRLGLPMPFTKQLIDMRRPMGLSYFVAWETLTHAESGWAGLK
jgi:hypothetical protein